jgi:hypothetical protein
VAAIRARSRYSNGWAIVEQPPALRSPPARAEAFEIGLQALLRGFEVHRALEAKRV